MLKHIYKNFETYPTNRVVAMIDSKSEADTTVSDLLKAGFDDKAIDESVGREGLMFLDPDGTEHGFVNKMIRKWQVLAQGEESGCLDRVRHNLTHGHAVVSVPASTDDERNKESDIMHKHHASDIRYYAPMYVEVLN